MRQKLNPFLPLLLVGIVGTGATLLACGPDPQLDVQTAPSSTEGADSGPVPQPTPSELPVGHPPISDAQPAFRAPSAQLPAGHPAVASQPGAGFEMPEVSATAGTGATGLRWTPPSAWVPEPPANAMRKAQYRVPGPTGDAQCVVYYFGPGQGGDPQSNVARWAGQFLTADGRPGATAMKTRELVADGARVLIVEVSGSFLGGGMMGAPSQPIPDQALLGAVVEGPDSNWFFKLTGPESTVEAQREGFDSMLKSVKKGR